MKKFYATLLVRFQNKRRHGLKGTAFGLGLLGMAFCGLPASASGQKYHEELGNALFSNELYSASERKGGDSVYRQLPALLSDVSVGTERKGGDSVYRQLPALLSDVSVGTERKGGDSVYRQLPALLSDVSVGTDRKGGDSVYRQLPALLSDVSVGTERKGGDSVYRQLPALLSDVSVGTERKGGDSVYRQLPALLSDVSVGTERKGGDSVYRASNPIDGLVGAEISIVAFPNPTSGAFRVEVGGNAPLNTERATLKVLDMFGKTIHVAPITAGHAGQWIDLGTQPAGVYFLVVESGTEKVVTRILKN